MASEQPTIFLQFFEQTPVLDEVVINQSQKELLKLSAYNYYVNIFF
jgi:hypothetical protein